MDKQTVVYLHNEIPYNNEKEQTQPAHMMIL